MNKVVYMFCTLYFISKTWYNLNLNHIQVKKEEKELVGKREKGKVRVQVKNFTIRRYGKIRLNLYM